MLQPDSGRFDRLTLLAYGAPALPLAALVLPAYIFLPTVYARDLGLGLDTVGLVLLLARLWDVVTDPLVGGLSDKIRGRFGRRRPWIVVGAPLVLVGSWCLFVPPPDAGPWYLLGWSAVLYLGWTCMILPLNAWGAELTPDYHERSRITAYREALVVVGTLLALGLPAALGYGDVAQASAALTLLAGFVIVCLPVALIALLLRVPEPAGFKATRPTRFSDGVRALVGNHPFRRLILAYLINGIANGLPATLFLMYVSDRLEAGGWAGPLLFVYFFAGIVAVPVWVSLSQRYGKHRTWCGAMIWASANFAMVPLLGPGDAVWFLLICVTTGTALGADLVLPASMQADVVDVETAQTGEARTGLYFALWGMTTKLALALAVGIGLPILNAAGFSAGGNNSPQSLWTLTLLYAAAPVIFKLSAIVLMWTFPITAEHQAALRQQIAKRA